MSKVIIAGSRDIKDYSEVEKAVKDSGFSITEIVSGCAPGVDTLAIEYAKKNNIPYAEFPANWQDFSEPCVIGYNGYGKHNKLAGFRRNQNMADYADALIAIRNRGKSNGTDDMIKQAKAKGLKVYVYHVD